MFERFTERARQVVVLAQEEARALKHNYIGTEHVLLGLLREEEGIAARVLESLDITVEEVRAQVVQTVGRGEEVTTGQIPFTPRAKKVLNLALREALSLGHNYVGTEHILLGIVREGNGVAKDIVRDLDADAPKVRDEVLRQLGGGASSGAASQTASTPSRPGLADSRRRGRRLCGRSRAWLADLGIGSRAMPLPKRFPNRDEIAAVRAEADVLEPDAEAGATRRLAGRVLARRDMGKLMFLDLVDRSGRIQLLVRPDDLGGVDVDLGDIVGVEGLPTKSRRGEPSLAVRSLELLAKIHAPLPDTFHGITDVEQRYRRRYLDLMMNEESRQLAATRTRIVSEIRAYLDGEGFLEVETPILQPRYGGGFAEPFVTHSNELDRDLYLRIADELYLKRLIVGGLEKVYELGKDFRNESISYKHSPEFTQVEWYEAYADYRDTMERTETLVERAALAAIGTTSVSFRGHEIDLSRPWRRAKFVDLLEEKGVWSRDSEALRARLQAAGVDTKSDTTLAQLADHAYSHFVEPNLIEPTIVHDWPLEMSPFARTTDYDDTLVERFECVVGGMEFANAFSELNDSVEQAERFALQETERAAGDVEAEPGDPDFVEALSYGMPPTGGCGIGVDRLAMVLTGNDTIRDVILFPALREG